MVKSLCHHVQALRQRGKVPHGCCGQAHSGKDAPKGEQRRPHLFNGHMIKAVDGKAQDANGHGKGHNGF